MLCLHVHLEEDLFCSLSFIFVFRVFYSVRCVHSQYQFFKHSEDSRYISILAYESLICLSVDAVPCFKCFVLVAMERDIWVGDVGNLSVFGALPGRPEAGRPQATAFM